MSKDGKGRRERRGGDMSLHKGCSQSHPGLTVPRKTQQDVGASSSERCYHGVHYSGTGIGPQVSPAISPQLPVQSDKSQEPSSYSFTSLVASLPANR